MASYYALRILRAIRSRLAEQGSVMLLIALFRAVGPKPEAIPASVYKDWDETAAFLVGQ
jgi:hypothetical protein